MKRSFTCVADHTRSKRPRLVGPLQLVRQPRDLVSATHLYNYMKKDPIVDWLKLHSNTRSRSRSRSRTRARDRNTKPGFTDFIMKRGVQFERELIKYINDNKVPVITVSTSIDEVGLKKAKDLMMHGAPILHSVPVRDKRSRTQGIIDLLVRSDYLHKLVDVAPLSEEERVIAAPKLGSAYHYVVIDIKFSTLPLRADGIHLLNSGCYPAYKAQCLIYTQIIGAIQGYTAPYAFIMGRRWRSTSRGVVDYNYTCLNVIGKICYETVDNDYKALTRDAIKWVRDVRRDGKKWSVDPPSRIELYPNMCVDSGVWNAEKQKIAKKIGEMTNIWYVGIKHRNEAIRRGIKSWKDKRCTPANMGLRGVRAPIISKILNINRQNKVKIMPRVIKSDLYNWKHESHELFVDFETFGDIFADFGNLPRADHTNMIFMIGVGWAEKGKWNYKSFICTAPTYDEEFRIMDEFTQFFSEFPGVPRLYHWVAEERFWNNAECRQFDRADDDEDEEKKDRISDRWDIRGTDWADLCQLFRSEPIVLKDCYNFGLKSIAKAMRKHKMISAHNNSDCDNGMTAMVNAWECYKQTDDPLNSDTMKDIVKYNEFDCKVLWEILTYLRKNHSSNL